MAKRCEICGKGPVVGRQHSHANNVSARRFEPNLQTVRAIDQRRRQADSRLHALPALEKVVKAAASTASAVARPHASEGSAFCD